MDRYKRSIAGQYEGKGEYVAGAWKEDSDRSFTPEVARRVYESLQEAGAVPPPEQNFVFVSPTANRPTHERTFFAEDQKTRTGNSTFLVGDISKTALTPDDIHQRSETGVFQYFRWDAEHLPIKDSSVDMIWDRKGWLWHAAESEDPDRLLKAFEHYGTLLKEGGVIVIDNASEYRKLLARIKVSEVLRGTWLMFLAALGIRQTRPSELHPPRATEHEDSTVKVIDDAQAASGVRIWNTLHDQFDVLSLGTGLERVLVLRKRSIR